MRSFILSFVGAAALAVAVLTTVLLACSSTASSPGGSGSGSGGGSGGGGGCPCTVGNSGIHYSLACGQSACITLNGTATGYDCGPSGAVVNQTLCTNPAPVEAGPGCAAQSSSQLDLCGAATDNCGDPVTCPGCSGALFCRADSHCATPAANVIVIGNYQGGTFTINVDQHLPGLGIGLVSYDPMTVTITGTYASDVVQVVHAGYDPGTTVTGLSGVTLADFHLPKASPDGGPADVIVDDIGGPGTTDAGEAQVAQYFVTTMGGAGTVVFHQCQYDAYSGTLAVSAGGSCP
jgi:hypothetical protein